MTLHHPDSLYLISKCKLSSLFPVLKEQLIRILPTDVLFDVFYEMAKANQLCNLTMIFSELTLFVRFLNHLKGRVNTIRMHQLFQSLMDHDNHVASILTFKYQTKCLNANNHQEDKLSLLELGLKLGTFLSDSGWFSESRTVFESGLSLYNESEMGLNVDEHLLQLIFECNWRLVYVMVKYCQFSEAKVLISDLEKLISKYNLTSHNKNCNINIAQLYCEISYYHFVQSYYDDAYKWSLASMDMINTQTPPLTLVDVFRQCAKACVAKREFKKAKIAITQSLIICKEMFNLQENGIFDNNTILHPKLADVFQDYGFYLLNADYIQLSTKLYEMALAVRKQIFCLNSYSASMCNNNMLSFAYEDLAYGLYVKEYSSGHFESALQYADNAMRIGTQLLPHDHLILATSKRVKALILEEIAIDQHEKEVEDRLLFESEQLHVSALQIAKQTFGELNVQTAKHYGNLGRLYQSMKKYDEAEEMHRKSILIKKQILGENDYEVALSIGHLASLYNYDLGFFAKAEQLYLKSVEISIKLFGEGYSGLEYDYRGLIKVYSSLGNMSKLNEFEIKLNDWRDLRDTIIEDIKELQPFSNIKVENKLTISEIVELFSDSSCSS